MTKTYNAIHKWARRHFGQPTQCEICLKDGLTGRFIHWASKNHTYTQHREDWIRICAKCHLTYDNRKPIGMTGKHHTLEVKNKISKSISGENNPFYGKSWDDFGGHPKGMKGKQHSINTKLKIANTLKIKYATK